MELFNEKRRQRREMEHRLALDLQGYLCGEKKGRVKWIDSRTHLMEVIQYLYQEGLMKDEFGMNMKKVAIADMVFGFFGLQMPRNLSTYLTRIRNIKGVKSMTLVDMNVYYQDHNNGYLGLQRCVSEL